MDPISVDIDRLTRMHECWFQANNLSFTLFFVYQYPDCVIVSLDSM